MNRIGWLILLLSIGLMLDTQAQKKGKPELKRYKNTLKKAKKGDLKASLRIAQVCKGHLLATDDVKDYKTAKEWYSVVSSGSYDPKGKTSMGMFIISLIGGYGESKNIENAKTWHQSAIANGNYKINTTYAPALDLADFFGTEEKAKTGDEFAQFQLARMYFDFGINYRKAHQWLRPLVEAENQDAIFLKAKWKAHRNRYHSYRQSKLQPAILFYLLEKHAKAGSTLAKLEWIEQAQKTQETAYRLPPEKVLMILSNFKTDLPEMQFKMLFIRQQYEKGIQKYTTLREMMDLNLSTSDEKFAFAKGAIQEFQMMDAKLKNITSLGDLFRQNPNMNEVNFDVSAYRRNFEGDIRPLVNLQKQISTSQMRKFLGKKNYQSLKTELEKKVNQVMNVADDFPMLLMTCYKGFQKDVWLRSIYYPYNKGILDKKLTNLGINSENIRLYEEMHELERQRFTSLDETRKELYKIESKNVSLEDKITLKSFLKLKGIRDVLGISPAVETITQNKKLLLNTSWLQPEGTQEYFRYTSDSQNWFSGDIKHPRMPYHYILKAKGNDKYTLTIKGIKSGKSQLVYSSTVDVQDHTHQADEYTVKVYLAERPRYEWKESAFDYLKVTYPATGKQFIPQAFGKLQKRTDKLHGKSETQLTQKAGKADFSKKTAIRSAVIHFIQKYNRALETF